MEKTYIDDGYTVTVIIPDRTPDEQKLRDGEIEESLSKLYLSIKEKQRRKNE